MVWMLAFSTEAFAQESMEDSPAALAHRMGTLIVRGEPGARVQVEQLRHEFWFGAALSNRAFSGRMPAEDVKRYREVFLENFNSAVTENALKWLAMERTHGQVEYRVVDRMLDWTDAHDIPLRGHNVFWGIPNRVMDWQKELDDDDLWLELRARARSIAGRYQGRFAEYDLNNEMVHANYYEDRFGPDITRQMAAWFHEVDPAAQLYLNDYDILTGRRLDDYVEQIRGLLAQGVTLAGIGVQGHLHGESFDPEVLRRSLDELAVFGLPIRVTEFNLPGQRSRFLSDNPPELTPEEEAAKARDIVAYYRICFAHPAVEGILMWGFWEGANWIPASSLYRRDWSPTPAAEAYQDLIYNEWWTRWEGELDAEGRAEVPAFFGRHQITSISKVVVVEWRKVEGAISVNVK